jgi:mannonate dehydratase
MNRRDALKHVVGGAGAAAAVNAGGEAFWQLFGRPEPIEAAQTATRRGLPPLKITDVKVILTEVGGARHCNAKVYTSEAGLYGVGCGTHAERPTIVGQTIDQFLKPMVVGRNVDEIEDIWQTLWVAPYWRASVDANNAMSAVDGALWDIMGKRAGMPVYDLLGGKVRPACRMFMNASGQSLQALEESVRAGMEKGFQHFRFGGVGDGTSPPDASAPEGPQAAARAGRGVGPAGAADLGRGAAAGGRGGRGAGGAAGRRPTDAVYINRLVRAYEHLRKTVGFDVELCTDVHENPTPTGSLMLAKALEPFRPFFLEDLFSPEDVAWYQRVREEAAVGIAMGELFVNRNEWLPLVANRWIDFMRMHISAAGGLNMARKVAMTCEFFGVRTAWHGPANVSPIGHAVNLHIDLAAYNFGIGEGGNFSDQIRELFPGAPEIRNGLRYANDQPGLGIDVDEKVAAKYPLSAPGSNRGARDLDGAPRNP